MHIFLTGARGIGKSTVIGRVAALIGAPCGGFRTFFPAALPGTQRVLCLAPAAAAPVFSSESVVVYFDGETPRPLPERFDVLGARCLSPRGDERLILMDECGRLESEALGFQAEIERCLNGAIPVLGVLQENAGGYTARIASRQDVRVLRVGLENRDALPERIADYFLKNASFITD